MTVPRYTNAALRSVQSNLKIKNKTGSQSNSKSTLTPIKQVKETV